MQANTTDERWFCGYTHLERSHNATSVCIKVVVQVHLCVCDFGLVFDDAIHRSPIQQQPNTLRENPILEQWNSSERSLIFRRFVRSKIFGCVSIRESIIVEVVSFLFSLQEITSSLDSLNRIRVVSISKKHFLSPSIYLSNLHNDKYYENKKPYLPVQSRMASGDSSSRRTVHGILFPSIHVFPSRYCSRGC